MVNSLPDFLWLYALLHSIRLIWNDTLNSQMFGWIAVAVISAFASEVMQRFGFVPGTFDAGDVLAYSLATFLFFIQIYKPIYLNQLNLLKL